jgi:5'-nucleotidase/UDP-sugar diphosphatase
MDQGASADLPDDAGRIRETWDEGRAIFSTNVRAPDKQCFPGVPTNRLLTIRHPKDGQVLLHIGLIALTTDRGADKIRYAKFRKPIEAAQEQLHDWQRSKGKPDVVVALTHESLSEDQALARAVPGIDLILGGHEHENAHRRALPDLDPAGRLLPSIFRADANVRTVYLHHLTFDLRSRRLLRIHSHLKVVTDAITPDPDAAAVVEKYVRQAGEAFRASGLRPDEILGEATEVLDGRESQVRNGSTLLTKLVGEAMLDALKEAPEYRRAAVYNGGAIRLDDLIRPGTITMYDILRVLPYAGDVWSVRIKGQMLKRILEARDRGRGSGAFLQTANITSKAEGAQHLWLIGSHELDPNADYHVAINDYLLEGRETGLEFLGSLKDSAGRRRIGDWRKVVGDYLKATKKWPPR